MVAPGSTGHSLDILLKFTLDAAANDRVQRGVSTLEEELKRLGTAFPGKQLAQDTEKFNTQLKATEKTAKQTSETLRTEARLLTKQAGDMIDGLKNAQLKAAREVANTVAGISRSAGLLGTGILGGAFALANKYVKDAERATAVTVAWERAQESLQKSGLRVGAVLAREALPLLEEAARLASKAAGFIESNPAIVQAALNTGKLLVGISILGTVVEKGIKLTADVKYLATIPAQLEAARLQESAAKKQLEAALLQAKGTGISGGKGPGGIGNIGGLLTAVAAFVPSSNSPAKAFGEDIGKSLTGSLGLVARAGEAASASLGNVAASLSPNMESALKAFEQYQNDNLAATQNYLNEKKSIEQSALESSRQANQGYAQDLHRINTQLSAAISNATKSYNQELARAEADNAKQRAQIIRDAGEEIARVEEQLQETLRKNRLEHETRTADLIAARDALGLAKENQRFNQEQSEARNEANQEIAQRRRDIGQRLADLQQSYEQERAERLADYQARLAEIRSNTSQQLAELRQKHQDELRQIQVDRNTKLRELNNTLNEERKQRHAAFIGQIRDLDAGLLGEKRLRDQHQAAMLSDLDKFLAEYRRKVGQIASLAGASGSAGGFAEGGYTPNVPSTARVSEKGYEFYLSNRTTRAAEAMIGGRLTQQGLLAALSGMGGSRSGVVYQDQRRFSGEYTNAIRRTIQEDMVEHLERIFKD